MTLAHFEIACERDGSIISLYSTRSVEIQAGKNRAFFKVYACGDRCSGSCPVRKFLNTPIADIQKELIRVASTEAIPRLEDGNIG